MAQHVLDTVCTTVLETDPRIRTCTVQVHDGTLVLAHWTVPFPVMAGEIEQCVARASHADDVVAALSHELSARRWRDSFGVSVLTARWEGPRLEGQVLGAGDVWLVVQGRLVRKTPPRTLATQGVAGPLGYVVPDCVESSGEIRGGIEYSVSASRIVLTLGRETSRLDKLTATEDLGRTRFIGLCAAAATQSWRTESATGAVAVWDRPPT